MSKVGKLILIGLVCVFLVSGVFGGISFSKSKSDIIIEAWEIIVGDDVKVVKWEGDEIRIITDADIRIMTKDDLEKWMSLAQESGDLGAMTAFESIIDAIVELSIFGEKTFAIANLDDKEQIVDIVPVDRQLMPQGLTTIAFGSLFGIDDVFYLYDILPKHIEEARSCLKQKNVEQAIKVLERTVEKIKKRHQDTIPILHFYLGDIYLSQENFSKAIRHYIIGYRIGWLKTSCGRINSRILSNLGYACMQSNDLMDLHKAARTLKKLAELPLPPENTKARLVLLKVYEKIYKGLGDKAKTYKTKKEIKEIEKTLDSSKRLELKPKFWFKN